MLMPICPCDASTRQRRRLCGAAETLHWSWEWHPKRRRCKLGRLWLSQQALACPARSSHARVTSWRPSAAACAASHAAGRASPGVAAPAACRAAATASSPSPILQSAKKDCERFVSLEVAAAAIPSAHELGAWPPVHSESAPPAPRLPVAHQQRSSTEAEDIFRSMSPQLTLPLLRSAPDIHTGPPAAAAALALPDAPPPEPLAPPQNGSQVPKPTPKCSVDYFRTVFHGHLPPEFMPQIQPHLTYKPASRSSSAGSAGCSAARASSTAAAPALSPSSVRHAAS